jgi:hypothetical protein
MVVELAPLAAHPSMWTGSIAAVSFVARVCTNCGYAEFFVENPGALTDPAEPGA